MSLGVYEEILYFYVIYMWKYQTFNEKYGFNIKITNSRNAEDLIKNPVRPRHYGTKCTGVLCLKM